MNICGYPLYPAASAKPIPQEIHGDQWKSIAMATHACAQTGMDIHEYLRRFIDILCIFTDLCGYSQLSMDIRGHPGTDLPCINGYPWMS